MKVNDPDAFIVMGHSYEVGDMGLQQNLKLSFELFTRSSELGSANGHFALSKAYNPGKGVEKDVQKAIYYARLAAMTTCL